MNIEEVAALLDKPVSHIETMARGYTKKGAQPRPVPTEFEVGEAYYPTDLSGSFLVVHRITVSAEGRVIYMAGRTVAQCDSFEDADATADKFAAEGVPDDDEA